jgi:hypothetical protein
MCQTHDYDFILFIKQQGPTMSPVYSRRDGKVSVEYYAINVVVPQKLLYKSIQQLRSVRFVHLFLISYTTESSVWRR